MKTEKISLPKSCQVSDERGGETYFFVTPTKVVQNSETVFQELLESLKPDGRLKRPEAIEEDLAKKAEEFRQVAPTIFPVSRMEEVELSYMHMRVPEQSPITFMGSLGTMSVADLVEGFSDRWRSLMRPIIKSIAKNFEKPRTDDESLFARYDTLELITLPEFEKMLKAQVVLETSKLPVDKLRKDKYYDVEVRSTTTLSVLGSSYISDAPNTFYNHVINDANVYWEEASAPNCKLRPEVRKEFILFGFAEALRRLKYYD